MAYASITYTSASGTTFALTNSSGDPIEYLRQADIYVYVNNVLKTLTTDYTFNTAGTAIVLNTAVSGATVVLQRITAIDDPTVVYTAGSTLTAQDLNNADNQIRFGLQEFTDYVATGQGVTDGDKGDITVGVSGSVWTVNSADSGNIVFSSGKLGIGTSSPGYSLDVAASDTTEGFGVRIRANATAGKAGFQFTNSAASAELTRIVADSNGLRIGSSIFSGNATAPYATAANGQIASKTDSPAAYSQLVMANGTQGYFYVNVADNYAWNAASQVMAIGKISANNRSINAAGTINASGADYAEYMLKSGNFNLAKGDVCGVNANGKITNTFADSVSFVVKSTNPSYVGGDTWGTEEIVGAKPNMNNVEEFAIWEAKLEAERQKVDRIAFAGQVPVNVTGATPGQYIVPIDAADGGIIGIAKDETDLTLPEYMRAVGKVIAIEDDGRARIIVKVV